MNPLSLFSTGPCFKFSLNSSFSNTKGIFTPDFLPTPHISRTFGSKRENRLATLCFESDVYDELRLRYFLHPQISLLNIPSPATSLSAAREEAKSRGCRLL
ncbi:MAG: hypothetical protein ACYTXT_17205 [Nostoc sp.]